MRFPAGAEDLLVKGTVGHRFGFASTAGRSNLAAGQPDGQLAEADVVFGQLDPLAIMNLPRLKWIHITTAGYEPYDREDLRQALRSRGAILTNSSTVYAEPCAEHALGLMLAHARQLPVSFENQLGERGWPYLPVRAVSQVLVGQSALLLGFGHIGRRLAELLGPFHMNVMCVRRTVAGDEPIPTYPQSVTERLLPMADHVIDLLPGGAGTKHFMTAGRFGLMKSSAVFYNIGRGTTVDQGALVAALQANKIAAAYLDVMDPEPLPAEHPLWSAPNCHITPHAAGGQVAEQVRLVEHFLDNLRGYTSGQALKDRII